MHTTSLQTGYKNDLKFWDCALSAVVCPFRSCMLHFKVLQDNRKHCSSAAPTFICAKHSPHESWMPTSCHLTRFLSFLSVCGQSGREQHYGITVTFCNQRKLFDYRFYKASQSKKRVKAPKYTDQIQISTFKQTRTVFVCNFSGQHYQSQIHHCIAPSVSYCQH